MLQASKAATTAWQNVHMLSPTFLLAINQAESQLQSFY